MVRPAMASLDLALATAAPSLTGPPRGGRANPLAARLPALAFALAVHLGAALLILFPARIPHETWRVDRATELTVVRRFSPQAEAARRSAPAPLRGAATHAQPPTTLPPSFGPGPAPTPAATLRQGQVGRPLAALRATSLGCALVGGSFAGRALEQRCAEALGRRLAEAPAIDGLPPARRAAFDAVAFEQDEHRAFFHLPTASTQYPHGAGGIASGPGSSEIFAHNVGDPSPPKDPLLLRQSRSLGPPVP